ncbi:MAG: response regulator [Acidobacteria bacterium]|nr:response regulator [Acidobacteriota bacterium]
MQESRSMLVVDDEPQVCEVIANLFSTRGYSCQTAGSGQEALSIFQKFHPQVVLSDVVMPNMNGLDVARYILQSSPEIAVILMTGTDSMDMAIQALRLGVSDFLLKPFDFKTAERSVREAVSKKQALVKREQEMLRLRYQLQEVATQSRSIAFATMESFCKTLELRDIETFAHVQRVSNYAYFLARKMGLSAGAIDSIRLGALLHDIGKVVVPDRVLFKPGPLNPDEWEVMKKHVDAGYSIVTEIPGLEEGAKIVIQHHEQYGGGGYPHGLRGEQICLGARIFAVVDTYDAITNDRPYRKMRSDAVARNEIRNGSGSQYDPKAVEAFLAIPSAEWIQAGRRNVKREMGATFMFPARVKNSKDELETAVLEEFPVAVS